MVEEVTPVGVLTTATHEAVDVVPQPHAPNHIKHIKSALDWSSTTLKVVNAAGNLFKNITPALKFGLRCTKIPSILISPYKAYELIVNLIKIFSHSGKFYDKVKAGLKSITLINDLTKATAAFLKIFITAKLISDTFGCWIPYFDVVDVFIGPIEIGLKGDSVFKLYKLRREINSLIKLNLN